MNIHNNYLSVKSICRDFIPVSESSWWRGVKSGAIEQPIRIGTKCLWEKEYIDNLVQNIRAGEFNVYFSTNQPRI